MSDTNQPRQITVSEMSPHVHSFGPGENKVTKISAWLIKWIEKSLESGSIKPFDFLPSKESLYVHNPSCYLPHPRSISGASGSSLHPLASEAEVPDQLHQPS